MCILHNHFLRLSFDIPYMVTDVVLTFFTSYMLRKHFKNQWQNRTNHTYSYIIEIKVLPVSHNTRFVYFIISKIQNRWYLLLWSTSGLKLTISFILRLIKTTIKWIFKHIANYCRFILVSIDDRQRILFFEHWFNRATNVIRGGYKKGWFFSCNYFPVSKENIVFIKVTNEIICHC